MSFFPPHDRDWRTGAGFANGLTEADIEYLKWMFYTETWAAYTKGLNDAQNKAVGSPTDKTEEVVSERVTHLPECFIEPNPLAKECRVCDALRACEQHARPHPAVPAAHEEYKTGYAVGVDMALGLASVSIAKLFHPDSCNCEYCRALVQAQETVETLHSQHTAERLAEMWKETIADE